LSLPLRRWVVWPPVATARWVVAWPVTGLLPAAPAWVAR